MKIIELFPKKGRPGCYTKSPTVQDMLQPISGLISCAKVMKMGSTATQQETFEGEKFPELLTGKRRHALQFCGENTNSYKILKFYKVFSLKSFPLYGFSCLQKMLSLALFIGTRSNLKVASLHASVLFIFKIIAEHHVLLVHMHGYINWLVLTMLHCVYTTLMGTQPNYHVTSG